MSHLFGTVFVQLYEHKTCFKIFSVITVVIGLSNLYSRDLFSSRFHHSSNICAGSVGQVGSAWVPPRSDVRFHRIYSTGVSANQHLQQKYKWVFSNKDTPLMFLLFSVTEVCTPIRSFRILPKPRESRIQHIHVVSHINIFILMCEHILNMDS